MNILSYSVEATLKNPVDGDLSTEACDICHKLDFRVYLQGEWISTGTPPVAIIDFNRMRICESEDCKKKAKNKAFL